MPEHILALLSRSEHQQLDAEEFASQNCRSSDPYAVSCELICERAAYYRNQCML